MATLVIDNSELARIGQLWSSLGEARGVGRKYPIENGCGSEVRAAYPQVCMVESIESGKSEFEAPGLADFKRFEHRHVGIPGSRAPESRRFERSVLANSG